MENPNSKWTWVWGALLGLSVLAAYGNSFNGVFIFDDQLSIVKNDALHDLTSPSKLFSDYRNITRPVVALTLAIDYALFKDSPGGYHGFNVAAHVIAALLLFGIVRRALLSEKMRERFGAAPSPLAFCAALLWGVHPIQTESVTYIIQRAESMMGMFFLLALYCAIRGGEPRAEPSSSRISKWHAAAIAAAALGAGCKQVIVALPFVVLLYDRCFISGSFKGAMKRAPNLYGGLLISWVVVGVLLALFKDPLRSAGFSIEGRKWHSYAFSQFPVIVHYVRLALWPVDLVLDYGWRTETEAWRIASRAAIVLAALAVTLWQLRKNTALGFCGAWFFLILAPTSTIYPIGDLCVEHRMYLPLAAIAAVTAAGLYVLLASIFASATDAQGLATKCALGVCVLCAVALGILTAKRNAMYQDPLSMYEDVLVKRWENPRALVFVGEKYAQSTNSAQLEKAHELADRAVTQWPKFFAGHDLKGKLLFRGGDFAGAARAFQTALDWNPEHIESARGLVAALDRMGKSDEAFKALHKAAALSPKDAQIQWEFGNRLFQTGQIDAAIQVLAAALPLAPDSPDIHNSLGAALATARRMPDALREFDESLKYRPNHGETLFNRGNVLEIMGRAEEAVASYRAALKASPDRAATANALAWILATSSNDKLRDGKEGVALAEKACELTQRGNPLMLDTLAAAYAEAGQFDKGVSTEERALKLAASNEALAKDIRAHLELFKAGKAYHETKR